MSEESLKFLSMDELCALMIKAIDDYLLLEKVYESKTKFKKMRAELRLIHKVIADKKAESQHKKCLSKEVPLPIHLDEQFYPLAFLVIMCELYNRSPKLYNSYKIEFPELYYEP